MKELSKNEEELKPVPVPTLSTRNVATKTPVKPMTQAKKRWLNVKATVKFAGTVDKISRDQKLFGTTRHMFSQSFAEQKLSGKNQQSKESKSRLVIMPDNTFRKIWDQVYFLLLMYTLIFVPYQIAFSDEDNRNWSYYLELVTDVLFLMDMIFQFFSAYEIEDEFGQTQLITSLKTISLHYLKTWFLLDLLANFPFQWAFSSVDGYNRQLRFLRLPRLFKMLRFLRILKTLRLIKLFSQLRRWGALQNLHPGLKRMAKFVFFFIVFTHWCACAWFFISFLFDHDIETWVYRDGLVGDSQMTQYIAALYWALATLTTMGYGDIVGETTYERSFTILCMLIGVSFYSYLTATVASFMDTLDDESKQFREKMEQVESFMTSKKLSRNLKDQIRGYLKYSYERRAPDFAEDQIIGELSSSLQLSIIDELYGDIIPKFPFLKNKDPMFIASLFRKCVPQQAPPNKIILREGSIAQEFFLLNKGRVEMVSLCTGRVLVQLPSGSFFGEISLLTAGKNLISVRTVTPCDLFAIQRKHLDAILNFFPDVELELRSVAKERLRRIKEAKNNVTAQTNDLRRPNVDELIDDNPLPGQIRPTSNLATSLKRSHSDHNLHISTISNPSYPSNVPWIRDETPRNKEIDHASELLDGPTKISYTHVYAQNLRKRGK
eukprot:TRINITY_DN29331_c0_g4_i3.p1 TRINITY_DN29331_c0_g4~~TRINITY_DN29331_c0_g4_i3.p1  ORF type:complete len:662 (-),score=145.30 TRINITY_DN29331_c0_g4_i3:1126-3111(-)